jgi:hypothetical protein
LAIRDAFAVLARRWNWKSALFGALLRAHLFFAANLTGGRRAAVSAALAEFTYRVALCGVWGSLSERARRYEPAWLATGLLAAASHAVEYAVHSLRGTPNLRAGMIASVAFTLLSTSFNLYAMRRGALLAGEEGSTLLRDMARMPALVAGFVESVALAPKHLRRKMF